MTETTNAISESFAELFDKGRSLYNYGPAREAAGKGQPLVVFGNFRLTDACGTNHMTTQDMSSDFGVRLGAAFNVHHGALLDVTDIG